MASAPPSEGFLLTRQSIDRNLESEISLWLWSEQGAVQLKIRGEKPLFFISQSQSQQVSELLARHQIPVQLRPLALRDFAQQPQTGCYFTTLAHYYRALELLQLHGVRPLEADIRLADRFLMERFITGGVRFSAKLRREGKHWQAENPRLQNAGVIPRLRWLALRLTLHSSGAIESLAMQSDGGERLLLRIGVAQTVKSSILWVVDENALLSQFEQQLHRLDPDLLLVWEQEPFWQPLLNAATRLKRPLRIGRAGATARWRAAAGRSLGKMSCEGRVIIGLVESLRSASWHFEEYSLSEVAEKMLSEAAINDNCPQDERQLRRVAQMAAIFERCQLLPFLIDRSRLTGLELGRSGGSIAAFDYLYLPRLHRHGYIAPNRRLGEQLHSPGGFVCTAQAGLYKQVLVFDFKSLYPSIIRTFGIDPLALIEGALEPTTAIAGHRGGCFSRSEQILPELIATLSEARDAAKIAANQPLSQAIKLIMNSFYGVLGAAHSRFFDPRLASSITLRGQEILQTTGQWFEELGYRWIYGDTDSIFIHIETPMSEPAILELGTQLAESINQRWREHIRQTWQLESHLTLQFEAHYHHFWLPTLRGQELGSKKRYAGLCKRQNGEMELICKGLETVRSDWTVLAQEFQRALLLKIFSDSDPRALIIETVAKVRSGALDEQLIYRKRLRQPLSSYQKVQPPQVRAAEIFDQEQRRLGLATKFHRRGTIHYWITTQGAEPCAYRRHPIDYQHYIDKQLKPIANALLPLIGLDFDSLLSEQMALF